jgi:hypothetical protein
VSTVDGTSTSILIAVDRQSADRDNIGSVVVNIKAMPYRGSDGQRERWANMTAEVIYGESYHLIGHYRRLVVVDDAGDLNPGERAQALNHVLRFASLSSSVAVFEEGVEGEHKGFIFNVRLGSTPRRRST